MIRINLLEKKKPLRLPVLMGVDLNEVNFRAIIIAYVVTIILESFVHPILKEDITKLQTDLKNITSKVRKEKKKLKEYDDIEEKVTLFEKQIVKLKKREKEVDLVMSQRSNPKNILSSIVKILPNDLWFEDFKITSEKKILIKGGAISYRSVGELITKINEMKFFGGSIIIKDSKTVDQQIGLKKYRVQSFSLEGSIKNF